MADLLGEDEALAQPNTLYRCLDRLLPHKAALFSHLKQRWEALFQASFEVLLYDLTQCCSLKLITQSERLTEQYWVRFNQLHSGIS